MGLLSVVQQEYYRWCNRSTVGSAGGRTIGYPSNVYKRKGCFGASIKRRRPWRGIAPRPCMKRKWSPAFLHWRYDGGGVSLSYVSSG